MATKLGRMIIYLYGLLPIKLYDPNSATAMPMATKRGKAVTYDEEL